MPIGMIIVTLIHCKDELPPSYALGANKHFAYAIVDGQHRLEAFRASSDAVQKNGQLTVEVIRVNNIDESNNLYEIHNQALAPVAEERIAGNRSEWPTSVLTGLMNRIKKTWLTNGGQPVCKKRDKNGPQYLDPTKTKDALSTFLAENRDKFGHMNPDQLFEIIKRNNRKTLDGAADRTFKNLTKPRVTLSQTTVDLCISWQCMLPLISIDEWFDD
jgi:hypothetical protein